MTTRWAWILSTIILESFCALENILNLMTWCNPPLHLHYTNIIYLLNKPYKYPKNAHEILAFYCVHPLLGWLLKKKWNKSISLQVWHLNRTNQQYCAGLRTRNFWGTTTGQYRCIPFLLYAKYISLSLHGYNLDPIFFMEV